MAALASSSTAEGIEDASDVVKSKPQSAALRAQRRASETDPGGDGDEGRRMGLLQPSSSPNGEVPGSGVLESVNLNEPPPQRSSNSDSDGSGSQTVLLRRGGEGGGGRTPVVDRLESLRFSSRIDFTQTDTFRVGGKTCTVTLEEDRITWAPVKSSGKECLYLSDIFAVIPSPPRSRGPRRLSSSSMESCCEFTIHALRAVPGSPGVLTKLTFRSTKTTSVTDACDIWVQQIKHQLQNFGNRPRRLYVVVNPASGEGTALRVWSKVERLFQLTHITTEILFTDGRMYGRDVHHATDLLRNCDLSQYDGVVAVGGDGTVNEVLTALVMQAQVQSGVNTRRSRFAPVSVNQRLGIVPTGLTNSVARSILGCMDPYVAAAQIMLGCNTPMDVSSISRNGQLQMFSAGVMAYGFWSDMKLFSQDFAWLGTRRYNAAIIRTLISHRSFDVELSYVPIEEPTSFLEKRERCFSRCNKCANFDCSLESPASACHKGASVLATYSEEDTIDQKHWRKLTGHFSNVMVCPHACSTHHAPLGFSPYGHLGNGGTDIVLLSRCSKLSHARWLLRQKKSRDMFDLPYLQILRVKEFKFREVPRTRALAEEEEEGTRDRERSVDNLMQEDDDDEVTNQRGSSIRRREQEQREREGGGRGGGGGGAQASETRPLSSRWNIDGNEIQHSDIEVRVHRHLISMLARGVEPLPSPPDNDPDYGHRDDSRTDQQPAEQSGMI
ncbi:Ceramide kinase [Geodia barretti]|uniref:Ceramide kinase n=1 Tax=Geodia barretti TaxID=519541 RepID=A0AA35WWT2_GEOBA|nr:Ceramide kinase [Geodia barretti]